jgi:uncharacterized membrane protein YbaN (DUF454 family)
MNINPIKKYLLIIAGSLSLFLGILGIFLPILPTTPFLLLTSICYLKSSKRLHTWLMKHKILGPYIYNYITYKAIKKSVKISSLCFLWVTLSTSIYIVNHIHVRILLSVIGVLVSLHILSLKTLPSK